MIKLYNLVALFENEGNYQLMVQYFQNCKDEDDGLQEHEPTSPVSEEEKLNCEQNTVEYFY